MVNSAVSWKITGKRPASKKEQEETQRKSV